jgi:hypothetical protein
MYLGPIAEEEKGFIGICSFEHVEARVLENISIPCMRTNGSSSTTSTVDTG